MTGKDKLLKQALSAAKKANYYGIFLMPTGSGKGRLMIEIIKLLNPKKILYLCNSELLRDVMFKDELIKWHCKHYLDRIDFECYQTAYKWVGREYDIILADEFDASLTPQYSKVYFNNTFKYKILVSATLDADKKRLAKKIAPIVFERKITELIADEVLNKVNYYFINYNLSTEENGMYLYYNNLFRKLLNQYQTKEIKENLEKLQIQRKQFLSKLNSSVKVTKWLVNSLRNKKEKILIFCGLSEQADRICKYAYHSNNNEEVLLQKFNNGEIRELAVVNKVDRGLNIDDIRHIVHESFGRSKTRFSQRTGRGMRLDINDVLSVYILIPWYLTLKGERKPTVIQNWLLESTEDLDLKNAKSIKFEEYEKK